MTPKSDSEASAVELQSDPIQLPLVVDSQWKRLNFDIECQQKTNWCWAALAASVARYYHPSSTVTQCEIANGELRRNDCCKSLALTDCDPCNVIGFLMSSLFRVGSLEKWAVRRPATSKRLQKQIRRNIQEDIREEIDQERPLCARIVRPAGGGHFIAIFGYASEATHDGCDKPQIVGVAVADPLLGESDVDWEDFPMRYYTGAVYTDSYYTKGKGKT
jgi:hypothetical protein